MFPHGVLLGEIHVPREKSELFELRARLLHRTHGGSLPKISQILKCQRLLRPMVVSVFFVVFMVFSRARETRAIVSSFLTLSRRLGNGGSFLLASWSAEGSILKEGIEIFVQNVQIIFRSTSSRLKQPMRMFWIWSIKFLERGSQPQSSWKANEGANSSFHSTLLLGSSMESGCHIWEFKSGQWMTLCMYFLLKLASYAR